MDPSTRGPRVASRPLLAIVTSGVLAFGCVARPDTPLPTPTAGPGVVATPRLPTPVPTVLSSGPGPGATEPPTGGRLLLRLTTCDDTCGPVAGTTILDDGRIIWEPAEGQIFEGRLTAAGLEAVIDAIEAVPALGADGSYVATLRPGAQPIPHGVASHRFDVAGATGPVVVNAWDPDSLADQLDAWDIPPEMGTLDDLATRLADPVSWLGADAFEAEAGPYSPDRYVVVVDLFPDAGDLDEFPADVDEIEWPFGGPIEAAGDPIGPGEDGLPPRCLILDAADAASMRAAEADAGSSRDLRDWLATVAYDWRRADGFVQVTTIPLLPHEQGACADLVVTPP